MRLTRKKLSIISLLAVLVIALSAFFGLHSLAAKAKGTANAMSNGILKTSINEDSVEKEKDKTVSILASARKVADTSRPDGIATHYYAAFRFVNNAEDKDKPAYAYYNNKLAYRWLETYDVGSGDAVKKEVREGWFSMEFGFEDLNFEKFVLTFESQQYTKSKDGKTANYVMFFPKDNETAYVQVTDNKDLKLDDINESDRHVIQKDHIRIEFLSRAYGEYSVKISNQNTTSIPTSVASGVVYNATFKNIGGDYVQNVTTGTTVHPIMFKPYFNSEAEKGTLSSVVVLYSINNQEFASSAISDQYTDLGLYKLMDIDDTCPPVLCFEKDPMFLTQGSKVDFKYQVIDVLRTSASGNIHYYVLSKDNKKAGDDGSFDYTKETLFKEVTDKDILETDYDAYLPMAKDVQNTKLTSAYDFDGKPISGGSLCADMLVKAFIRIYDTTGSYQQLVDMYVDWYMPDEYKVVVNGTPFIAVAKDTEGATFNYYGKDGKTWNQLLKEYQAKVDEAAKDLKAGSTNYFYLPSPEDLFVDNATAYRNMKISVYYYGKEESSNTSLDTSNLSINVNSRGTYTFTVYAHDAADNKMYYFDNNGKKVEFASSEVWTMFKDKEDKDKLPWFTFNVKYSGAEFDEDPGLQSTGFVGVEYSTATFKVNGVDYSTTYRLFLFNREAYFKDKNISFNYDEFVSKKDELFNEAETRKYFTEIIPKAKMEETDAEYEKFSKYNWSETGTSFTPQEAGYYLMIAQVKDGPYVSDPITKSLAIVVSESAKSLKGESDWLQKNLTSIILLSIAGLALIGIILLLVIKPREKEDIDTRFEEKLTKSGKKTKNN